MILNEAHVMCYSSNDVYQTVVTVLVKKQIFVLSVIVCAAIALVCAYKFIHTCVVYSSCVICLSFGNNLNVKQELTCGVQKNFIDSFGGYLYVSTALLFFQKNCTHGRVISKNFNFYS